MRIRLASTEGFVSKRFINKTSGTQGLILARLLNIRRNPDGEVLGKVLKGTQVEILSEEGDWLKVKSPVEEGYVSSTYVRRNGRSPSWHESRLYIRIFQTLQRLG